MPLGREGRARTRVMPLTGVTAPSRCPNPERILAAFPLARPHPDGNQFPGGLVQTGVRRREQRTRVPDKHPDGVGHQEGVIQRPEKLLVVVPIWKGKIRATSAGPPSCFPSPWPLARPHPRPRPQTPPPGVGAPGGWPGAIAVGTGSHPSPDFATRCCCPLARAHRAEARCLITAGCLTSSQPPAKNLRPRAGGRRGGGEPTPAAWSAWFWGDGGLSLTEGCPAAPGAAVGAVEGVRAQGRAVGVQLALRGGREGVKSGSSGTPTSPLPRVGARSERTLTMLMGFRERW